jgi:hypothetical protein
MAMRFKNHLGALIPILLFPLFLFGQIKDEPYPQATSVKFESSPELKSAKLLKLEVDYNNNVYVLTDKGLYRDFYGSKISKDLLYRKLSEMNPVDITTQEGSGYLYYLYADRFLTNAHAGTIFAKIPENCYQNILVNQSGVVMLAGLEKVSLYKGSEKISDLKIPGDQPLRWYVDKNIFYALSSNSIKTLVQNEWKIIYHGENLTCMAFSTNKLMVGTKDGYLVLNPITGKVIQPLKKELPVSSINDLLVVNNQTWFSTSDGAFREESGKYRYFQGERWLVNNDIIDMEADTEGNIYLLSPTGLSKIEFSPTTLAAKTKKIQDDIRKYHMRYGFVCEINYLKPGDLTTAQAVDNDNDGLWTTLYLGSQAFRFATTGEEIAKRYAWESFEAFERLLTVNPLKGFPSRTFERKGIIHDTLAWRPSQNPEWDWKGTTSTDEYIGYLFVATVMDHFIAKTAPEKRRIADFIDAIMTHIIDNNYYFIDVDGQPTRWGRWNPDYVNSYAKYVDDRKLNSAHLIAGLQLAYSLTGKEKYKSEAFKMMDKYGYLDNIMIPMKTMMQTTEFVHKGEVMGDTWNHSDDEMSFLTYWVLHKYAFNDSLKKKYEWVAQDHWEIERPEKDGLWNLLTYGISGNIDLNSTIWYLREYTPDLDRYSTKNSHRKDLVRIPDNFREQITKELLTSGERPMIRHNTNPFALDCNDGRTSRLAGDEYLLPYWMARYLKVLE